MFVDVSFDYALTDVSKDMFLGFRVWMFLVGLVRYGLALMGLDCDEPESLILAQSERWRHA